MREKVNLGVVGCGGIACRALLPSAARLENLVLRAFMDVSAKRAETAGEQFGGTYHTTDVERLLEDDELDAVLVATLPDTHVSYAVRFLEAGKHVLAQKPLGVTYEQCRQIVQAERRARAKLMTAYCFRLSPLTGRLRDAVREPRLIYARMVAPDVARSHRRYLADPSLGAPMLELACHNADLAYWLARSRPVRVAAVGGNQRHASQDVVDNFVATIGFESGTVATLACGDDGGEVPDEKWRTEVFGGGVTAVNHGFRKLTVRGARTDDMECEYMAGIGLDRDMATFRDMCLGDAPSPIPAAEGIVATVILLKAFESLESGRVEAIELGEYLGQPPTAMAHGM
ncbi:MAG: Gfo/Idh/MocA family oxidoreductase [Kiritimatiellae bacterium]|nr:Gfo/Idh/MocA family oxidoreductase [Kiritimatiellia bacterium]